MLVIPCSGIAPSPPPGRDRSMEMRFETREVHGLQVAQQAMDGRGPNAAGQRTRLYPPDPDGHGCGSIGAIIHHQSACRAGRCRRPTQGAYAEYERPTAGVWARWHARRSCGSGWYANCDGLALTDPSWPIRSRSCTSSLEIRNNWAASSGGSG